MGQNATDDELQDMLNEVDTDGNGTIDFTEFMDLIIRKQADTDPVRELVSAFNILDRAGNGYISAQELKICMDIMGEHHTYDECLEILREANTSNNG